MKNGLLVFFAALVLGGCTGSTGPAGKKIDYPKWLIQLPLDENYYFGVGTAENSDKARQKAVIDVGQQINVQVKTVLTEYAKGNEIVSGKLLHEVDRQITDQVVYGCKFVEQYEDKNGMYWILARAPVNCVLDMTEGIILSYSLELGKTQTDIDELVNMIETGVKEDLFKEVPWTPYIPEVEINIDGNMNEWENVPVFYASGSGPGVDTGYNLAYIKALIDSERAYFLLVCKDARWARDIVFEMNFDYAVGGLFLDRTVSPETDLHANISSRWNYFFDGHVNNAKRYDPGVKKSIKRGVFEFSVPLDRYKASWFNILSVSTWGVSGQKDLQVIDYEKTWLKKGTVFNPAY